MLPCRCAGAGAGAGAAPQPHSAAMVQWANELHKVRVLSLPLLGVLGEVLGPAALRPDSSAVGR
jgi:hypothetical protein